MTHRINSVEELVARYPAPSAKARHKQSRELNNALAAQVSRSAFCVIASVGKDGADASPRGDEPGQLVRVLDPTTLAIPDRPGSHRLETARNVIADGRVSVWFLSADSYETVRVSGTAHISVDPALLRPFELNGVLPVTVLVVRIEQVARHNDRALRQSGLFEHTDKS